MNAYLPSTSLARCLLPLFVTGAIFFASCSESPPKVLAGEWIYASGESEGINTSVSGSLKLSDQGSFDDTRYIGPIGGFRKGSFSVRGEELTLTEANGTVQTYTYHLGEAKDGEGRAFKTLLLRGKGLSFVLSKKQ